MITLGLSDSLAVPVSGSTTEEAAEPRWEGEFASGETTYDLFRSMRRFAKHHGFSHFLVMAEPVHAGSTLGEMAMISNWRPEMLRSYDRLSLLDRTPDVEWMRNSVEPLFWTLESHADGGRGGFPAEGRALFESFGHRAGVLFPVFSADAKRGGVGFSAPSMPRLDRAGIIEMAWISGLVFNRLAMIDQGLRASRIALTERETQCVIWIAAGKSSSEAAEILGISPHTVDYYLSAAGRKLNTVNRVHTVATALRLRLLR